MHGTPKRYEPGTAGQLSGKPKRKYKPRGPDGGGVIRKKRRQVKWQPDWRKT